MSAAGDWAKAMIDAAEEAGYHVVGLTKDGIELAGKGDTDVTIASVSLGAPLIREVLGAPLDGQCPGYAGDPGASAPRCESYRDHPGSHFIRWTVAP